MTQTEQAEVHDQTSAASTWEEPTMTVLDVSETAASIVAIGGTDNGLYS